MEVVVNSWGIVGAMLSSMAVGSLWYAQGVFGKTWMTLAKIEPKQTQDSVLKPIVITAVVSLITAYVLAHVAYLANSFFKNSFLSGSLSTAFWLWAGLIAARFVTHDVFEGRPAKLTMLNIAHEFVTLMVMGLVIGLIGL